MSTIPTISTSKATLMHASLAYLTDEIQTLDDIIHIPHTLSVSRKPILPTEILFLIREWLFPTITAQLITKSALALQAYEQSLCELLCSDCVAYNVDIYGPDIWQWEQFYGACACAAPAGNEDPHGYRSARISRRYREENYRSKSITATSSKMAHVVNILNPKQFADVDHWLEFYLSNEAAAREALRASVGCNAQLVVPSDSARSLTLVDIWDVVTLVLREFNCEAVREQSKNRGQFNTKRDSVQIVPSRHHMGSGLERVRREPDAEWMQQELGILRAQVTLHRASHNLGLMVKYTEALDFEITGMRRPFIIPVFTRRLCWSSTSRSYYARNCQEILDTFQTLLRVLASLAGACVSLPITCATLAFTVLCFYSKPRSLRIL